MNSDKRLATASLIGWIVGLPMKLAKIPTSAKPRCAKLHNWKPPKPTDDELVCMDYGTCFAVPGFP